MSSYVKVHVDNYNGSFYAGQTITGTLECYFHSEKKVKRIHLRFIGEGKTRWNESESYYDSHQKKTRYRTVVYYGEEQYFYNQIDLVSSQNDSIVIPSGRHRYPFTYTLPPNLPTSLHHDEYNITYKIEGTVDRPWKFDIEDTFYFDVFAPIDLNYIPECTKPIKRQDQKTVGCWCCKSGPIEMTVSMAKAGFAIGEKILMSINVSNMSNTSVDGVKIKLKQDINYHSRTPRHHTRTNTTTIINHKCGGIGAHGENTMNLELEIPPECRVPFLRPCSLIDVHYYLEVEAELDGFHMDMEMTIPIHLGHVALAHIGVPEVVTRQPAFMENSLPGQRSEEEDFVFIDHAPIQQPGMPMPYPPSNGIPAPMPMPMPGMGSPGMPPPMPMPMPPSMGHTGMPMPSTGMPMPPMGMPLPMQPGMSMPPMPESYNYPPSEKGPGYPAAPPSAPEQANPPSAPPASSAYPYSNGTAPPTYDEATTLPIKRPM